MKYEAVLCFGLLALEEQFKKTKRYTLETNRGNSRILKYQIKSEEGMKGDFDSKRWAKKERINRK